MHGWDSGQKWRPGSGRYANSGGKNKEKYDLYFKELKNPFFHPKREKGYWFWIAEGLDPVEARAKEHK